MSPLSNNVSSKIFHFCHLCKPDFPRSIPTLANFLLFFQSLLQKIIIFVLLESKFIKSLPYSCLTLPLFSLNFDQILSPLPPILTKVLKLLVSCPLCSTKFSPILSPLSPIKILKLLKLLVNPVQLTQFNNF